VSDSSLITRHWSLFIVLTFAAVLRLWAIDWGAPYLYHPDEHLILHPALNIVRDADLNPHWFQYPSLFIYVQSLLVTLMQPFVHAPLTTDPAVNQIGPWDALPAQWPFALGGRLAVAMFAAAGAWWLYRAGTLYAGPPVGIAAALFLASSPLHNESSHFLTTDVPATTLLTAAFAYSVAAAGSNARRDLAIAGCFAGLAAATKYTAGIVVLIPLAVALSPSLPVTARRAAVVIATAAVAFLIACPFALLDFSGLWAGILQQRQNYLGGYTPGSNWRWYLYYLYAIGLAPPLAVMGAVGLITAPFTPGSEHKGPWRLTWALILVPIVYFAVLSSYASRTERNLMLVLPFVCLFAADVGWRLMQRLAPARWAAPLFGLAAFLIAAPGSLECIRHDRQLARPDTRTVALQWIEANIPAGERIAREEYTPQVSRDRYSIIYEWSLAQREYGSYLARNVDHLVLSSNIYGRALRPPYVAGPTGPGFYKFVFEQLPLEVEIAPAMDRPGPTIRIYRVPHA